MNTPSDNLSYSNRFYNIKILKTYVGYLKENCAWPAERIEQLFERCGRDVTFLDSDDHWFGQDLADLFQEKVLEMTGDREISYKVGLYAFSSYAKGIIGRLVQGLISPQVIFKNIGKYSLSYSRGAILQPLRVTSTSAVLRSIPVEGCAEKSYQCQNRKGTLAAVPPFSGCGRTRIEETKCLHRGDPFCEYFITWEDRRRIPELPAAAAGVFGAAALFLWTGRPWLSLLAGLNLGWMAYFYLSSRTARRLQDLIREKDDALQESLRIFNRRYEENTLRQRILFNTFQTPSLEELCRKAGRTVKDVMHYDRVMILLADTERNVLKTVTSEGFEGEVRELVDTAEFNIDPNNTRGFFIRVLNTKEPLFLRDAPRKMGQLSRRSQKFLRLLGTQAFIAVPILASGRAAGVLAVENTDQFRPLVADDQDLLVEIAAFIGLVIPNIKNYGAVKKSEKLARALEEQERQLRKTFQKFVPGEVVPRLRYFGGEFLPIQKETLDVMFVDVMGFTTFSEACPPEEVADILNTYIDEVQEVVKKHHGRINKIIGDGLLIYFDGIGANSILAGYAILQSRYAINARLGAKGYAPISLGIGAHRGVCTIGFIGTEERLDYTLIGDTVNVASRIESYTRNVGPNTFCFSSSLIDEAGDFQYVSKGKVPLKGRKESVEVLQLLKPLKRKKAGPSHPAFSGK